MPDEKAVEDPGLPLGDIALDMVRRGPKGKEKYVIHPRGPEVLRAAVDVVFASKEPPARMRSRFKEVLKLCYVLEEREGSPKAARALAEALFSEPRVAQLFGGGSKHASARTRQYRKFLDEEDLARAPKLGDKPPEDALRLTAFVTPGQHDLTGHARRRAKARAEPKAAPRAGATPASAPPRRKPAGGRARFDLDAPSAEPEPGEGGPSPRPAGRRPPPGSVKG